jgi:coenzyme F420-0:L-glutamate ligase/coenzyme F420-1:gamma-L-glutamate ligase
MITIRAVEGIGEVAAGTDLAALVADHVVDGDIVVMTSKVVSKAEGRVRQLDKEAAVALETDREVARRGTTRIVRNRLGLTMAGAGVDASNVEQGSVVLLPLDPDASARALREALAANVAVIVSDTAGRAWRHGQTDLAIGAAGIEVAVSFAGTVDGYGNPLQVTMPAIADELASAGDLVKGKLAGCPVAVVTGLGHLVLPRGSHGPGAAALVREESMDLFGLGAREAVMHALLEDEPRGFGAAAPADVLLDALDALDASPRVDGADVLAIAGPRVRAAAFAHGWEVAEESRDLLRLRPRVP